MLERRPVLTDPEVLEALAHPVRLDLLTYLMSVGPATASQCARAVGDSPSNCSYHLRALAGHGLVEEAPADDRRTRPWRATITGFALDPDADPDSAQGRAITAVESAAVALEQRLLLDYLSHRDRVPPPWRGITGLASYTVRVTPEELRRLHDQVDALIRPLLAATRQDTPADAQLVGVGVYGFPRTGPSWSIPRR